MTIAIATPEAVENACNTHWQMTGTDPTYQDLIRIMGGGSNKTISSPLKAWLARPRPARHAVPQALVDESMIYLHQIWPRALDAARSTAEQLVRDAQTQVENAKSVRNAAMQDLEAMQTTCAEQLLTIERLQMEVAALRVKLEGTPELQARLHAAESDVQRLNEALNAAMVRASHAEGRLEGMSQRRRSPSRERARRETAPVEPRAADEART